MFFLQVPNHHAPSLSWCTNTCEGLCNTDGDIPCKSFPSLMFFCTKLSCKQGTADNAKLTVSLDRAGEVLPEQSCMEHFFFFFFSIPMVWRGYQCLVSCLWHATVPRYGSVNKGCCDMSWPFIVLLKTCCIWALSQLLFWLLLRHFEAGIYRSPESMGNAGRRDSCVIEAGWIWTCLLLSLVHGDLPC